VLPGPSPAPHYSLVITIIRVKDKYSRESFWPGPENIRELRAWEVPGGKLRQQQKSRVCRGWTFFIVFSFKIPKFLK
jgi:hypothetical protein